MINKLFAHKCYCKYLGKKLHFFIVVILLLETEIQMKVLGKLAKQIYMSVQLNLKIKLLSAFVGISGFDWIIYML